LAEAPQLEGRPGRLGKAILKKKKINPMINNHYLLTQIKDRSAEYARLSLNQQARPTGPSTRKTTFLKGAQI
jgi:hypothetical protein